MKLIKINYLTKTILLLVLVFSLSACSVTTSKEGLQSGGSVFFSTDKGDIWREAGSVISASPNAEKITNLNIKDFYGDPNDSLAVYLSTTEGLYYTYNISQGWYRSTLLPKEEVRAVAVSPDSKCLIYVALANKVYRSSDCSRSYTETYYDNDKEATVNDIAIDHYNPRNIYLGTSRGEIIKSIDGGASWRTIWRLDEEVKKVILSPLDSRLVFVATSKAKIFSFVSNTETNASEPEKNFLVNNFKDLNKVLVDLGIGNQFKDLVISESDATLLLATDKMILRSKDDGISWENLNLIQPDGKVAVNALAINPNNSQEIYYVTDTTFFRSADGGVTWATKKLPSARGGSALWIDFQNNNNIYLGTYRVVNKK